MIRQALVSDLDMIESGYREHFEHEKLHGAYTVFKEGVYPTRKDAEAALQENALYVYEENGVVLGSMIFGEKQPEEYKEIDWKSGAAAGEIRVIDLLMVRPSASGRGIGSSLIKYAIETAERQGCKAVRLNTGSQNIPAATLYQKLGFELAATSDMKVGGVISHKEQLFFEKIL